MSKEIKFKINSLLRKASDLNNKYFFKNGYFYGHPFSLQIEPTIRCNLNCIMCDLDMKNRSDKKDMTFSEFKKIIDQFPYLKNLNLTGYGEQLLNSDIFDMVVYAKQKGLYTHFSSNCMLLNEKNINGIIDSGLDSIIFSVDSGVKEVYNDIRRGADFDIVRNNIKKFMKLKEEKKSKIKTQIYSVMIFKHIDQLNELIDFAEDVGVKKVVLRGIFDHTGKNTEYYKDALYHRDNRDSAKNYISKAKKYADQKNILLKSSPLYPIREGCNMPDVRPYDT